MKELEKKRVEILNNLTPEQKEELSRTYEMKKLEIERKRR